MMAPVQKSLISPDILSYQYFSPDVPFILSKLILHFRADVRVRAGGAGVDQQVQPRGVRVGGRPHARRGGGEGHRIGANLHQTPLADTIHVAGSGEFGL